MSCQFLVISVSVCRLYMREVQYLNDLIYTLGVLETN